MTAKERLVELKYQKLKHIKVDKSKIGEKYNIRTANGLTKAIKDFLNLSGHFTERISTTGLWVRDKAHVDGGYYRTTNGTKGSADLSSTINGRSVKIEVKIGKDRLSEHQKAYRDRTIASKGVYVVATSFDQFMEWYDNFIKG